MLICGSCKGRIDAVRRCPICKRRPLKILVDARAISRAVRALSFAANRPHNLVMAQTAIETALKELEG